MELLTEMVVCVNVVMGCFGTQRGVMMVTSSTGMAAHFFVLLSVGIHAKGLAQGAANQHVGMDYVLERRCAMMETSWMGTDAVVLVLK